MTADEGEQREAVADTPSAVCPMDLFPSLSKLHLRGCPLRYFDALHLFARNATELCDVGFLLRLAFRRRGAAGGARW